jgi:hypothetical protein
MSRLGLRYVAFDEFQRTARLRYLYCVHLSHRWLLAVLVESSIQTTNMPDSKYCWSIACIVLIDARSTPAVKKVAKKNVKRVAMCSSRSQAPGMQRYRAASCYRYGAHLQPRTHEKTLRADDFHAGVESKTYVYSI